VIADAAELAGVAAFALSGGLLAARQGLDLFGALVLAVVTGLGGGIVRDVLLGIAPPGNLTWWPGVAAAVLAGAVAFRWPPRAGRALLLFDAGGLGLFTVNGAATALALGAGPLAAALMGLMTGVGGGVLRDVLAGQVPVVLQRDVYALPSLGGAVLVVAAWEVGAYAASVGVGIAALVVGVRLLAARRGWQAPRAPDVS
jgi:uncharacterized membrane protein YeiH